MTIRILNHQIHKSIVVLALAEFGLLVGSVIVGAHLFPTESRPETLISLSSRAAVYATALMMGLVSMGLYSTSLRVRFRSVVVRIAVGMGLGLVLTILLFYFLPFLHVDRVALIAAALLSAAGLVLLRAIFFWMMDESVLQHRVLVYGAGRRAASVEALKNRQNRQSFQLVGFVATSGDIPAVDKNRLVYAHDGLDAFVRHHNIHEVVVAMDDRRQGFPMEQFVQCRLRGVQISELVTFLERESGRVQLDVIHPSWLVFSEGFRSGMMRGVTSRSTDVAASFVLLAVFWPVMLLAALAIKFGDGLRAPVLYRQVRVGQHGHAFVLYKFRTMREDAEADGKARWASSDDDRVTKVGAFLRKTRLDELPQLWNVLIGEMSLVGPRPERPEFVEQLTSSVPYYAERHCVKPGVTGWAQLCYPYGASEKDALEKLKFDLYYVKNHSLLFDLAIILQTIEVVLWRKGSR
jgi:sugar transferase (PEP-CTERM system associated)